MEKIYILSCKTDFGKKLFICTVVFFLLTAAQSKNDFKLHMYPVCGSLNTGVYLCV